MSTDFTGQQMVIWGTDVIVDHCKQKFTKFLRRFVNTDIDEDETLMDMGTQLPFYMARLEEVYFCVVYCAGKINLNVVLLFVIRFLVMMNDF